MAEIFASALFDRTRLARAADALAVAVVVSLPWSTTATIILVVLWLGAVLPTLDVAAVRREVLTPAGGVPVLFWLLAAAGTLWADVSWHERLGGLDSFHRLLLIPLLLAQFRRSKNGRWIVIGFFASCTVLLAVSYVHAALWTSIPGLPGRFGGVPLKDYILQSEEFQLCAFGLAYVAAEAWRERRFRAAIGFGLLAAAFLADIVYLGTGRTALAVMPVLLVLFGWREFGWKGALAAALAGLALAAVFWLSSQYLRDRVTSLGNEIQNYESRNWSTSAGARIEFWKKSLGFVAAAPVIGHGTGSIGEQFRASLRGNGPGAIMSDNPHQQTLTVAIQLGLVGVAVLFALWIAHVSLFTGNGLVAWAGLIVVVQNIVGSLFNSHLFDFTQGWMYVFAVGALGGTVLAKQPAAAGSANQRRPMLANLNRRIKQTEAYRRYKHSVPYVTLKEWHKHLRRQFNLPKYRGKDFCCPVCGVELNAFKPVTPGYVRATQEAGYIYPLESVETFNIGAYYCPSCDATDRERLYALCLDDVFRSLDKSRRYRLVEFAPSFGLQRRLKICPFIDYRSADLFRRTVDDRIDITDMRPYAGGSVDIVLCSHVLEHVPDDRRAMRELHRILRHDGFGIVMVPLVEGVEETNEDPAIDTPTLRWKYFGSDDHVRQYGRRDFVGRLEAAGFAVERLGIGHFGADVFRRAGIAANSVLYVVRKAGADAAAVEAKAAAQTNTTAPRLTLPEQPRILVIAMRRLGDVLLTTPLVRTLHEGLPGARIDMLVFHGTEGMLAGNPDIGEMLILPQRPSTGELFALMRRLWRRYDLAISTQSGDRPAMLACAAGRRRIGFVEAQGGGGWWKHRALDVAIVADPENHRVRELLRLADPLGLASRTELVCPTVAAPPLAALAPAGRYAVLHANPMYRFRRWTDVGWRALALALAERGFAVVATGGPDPAERAYLDALWGPVSPPVQRLDGRLDWPQLSALIGGAAVFVGPDTSMTHLAASTGCPTVALYGPASPHRIGPWPVGGLDDMWAPAGRIQRRANVWVVQNPLPCLPCEKLGCDRHYDSHARCLDELSVSQVLGAVDEALAMPKVPA